MQEFLFLLKQIRILRLRWLAIDGKLLCHKRKLLKSMVSIGKLNCDARIFRCPFAPVENLWGAYVTGASVREPASRND